MDTATPVQISSLFTGQQIFLVQENDNRPNDLRLCYIGEIDTANGTAELVIKKPGDPANTPKSKQRPNGAPIVASTGVKAIVSTKYTGNTLTIVDPAQAARWEQNRTTFQIPTDELWGLNKDKYNRSAIRDKLENIRVKITTLQGNNLVLINDDVADLETEVDRLLDENPWVKPV